MESVPFENETNWVYHIEISNANVTYIQNVIYLSRTVFFNVSNNAIIGIDSKALDKLQRAEIIDLRGNKLTALDEPII